MAAYLSLAESQRRIAGYLHRFVDAIARQDGAALRPLLAVSSGASLLPLADALANFPDSSRLVTQSDQIAQFAEILLPLLKSIQSHRLRCFAEAYSSYEKAANAFLQEFRNWETPWAMEAVHAIALEIRLLAEKGDRELASVGKSPEKLQAAGSFLMKVFGALAGKGPKRVGALYITCQLFKIYFKLGTVHLCRSVIRSIETARIFDFEEFPLKDKVTYMYYTGRLEVFNESFLAADQKLTYALARSDPLNMSNMRMILKYLIPVKLSLGILPKMSLLKKYNLLEYKDVVDALKTGDVRLLRQALQDHEEQFLRSGVYLVLEKLELIVYQRLVKKIYIIQKQKDPDKAHQIKLDLIIKAFKWLGIDMDIDEGECIVTMLIYKNLVKGYFAHKSKVCVLSKNDPFPKLSGKPVMAS
ncbi:PCI domain-containing 2 [Rhynchospora pubera]|uniref:PCI domain-containing 2 n=1 Tax=Rhynchospora pubera TaxID=906938 RepID=A0AAV8C0J7_9POAL|nr:PCI domain-containing 2 [Rhynchospora pubera]KAJ4799334.1 PCI domain-containing 2 [Rhynchospora pubera]